MSRLYADSVVVLRADFIVDKYGNPSAVRDWANAVQTTVTNVSVQPDVSTEAVGDRGSVVTGWRLFTATGRDLDLLSTDRVEYSGMTLESDGEVARFLLAGRVHHVEARLRRVTG